MIYSLYSDWVGGQTHVMNLLPSFENMAIVEDSTDHGENAVQSMAVVAAQPSAANPTSHPISTLNKLPFPYWIASPSTACELFSSCYLNVPPNVNAELRNNFGRLCFVESDLVNLY